MTVKRLIEILQQHPQDMEVVTIDEGSAWKFGQFNIIEWVDKYGDISDEEKTYLMIGG